jgi:hypothetical protein
VSGLFTAPAAPDPASDDPPIATKSSPAGCTAWPTDAWQPETIYRTGSRSLLAASTF